jgi:hypothetical protein
MTVMSFPKNFHARRGAAFYYAVDCRINAIDAFKVIRKYRSGWAVSAMCEVSESVYATSVKAVHSGLKQELIWFEPERARTSATPQFMGVITVTIADGAPNTSQCSRWTD